MIRRSIPLLAAAIAGCASAEIGRPESAKPESAAQPAYAKPQLLIEPAELNKRLSEPNLRVLDCRSPAAFAAGHVPGAVRVDHADWEKRAKSAETFGDAKLWSKLIGDLGIDAKTTVVVLDAADQKDAARIWWLLRYWGVADAKLLNGGWPAWAAAKLPTTAGPVAAEPREFPAKAHADLRATGEDVAKSLTDKSLFVLDARSAKEHCGLDVRAKAGGQIPGAGNLDWTDLLEGRDAKRFKPAAELQKMFADLGVNTDRPIAVHCQSGGRASVMFFALELMGYPKVMNYYAGWSEWGNDPKRPVTIEAKTTGK